VTADRLAEPLAAEVPAAEVISVLCQKPPAVNES
jgi:hypothetical protein